MRTALLVATVALTLAATTTAASAAPAKTPEGALMRVLKAHDYGPPVDADCVQVARYRWECEWSAPYGGVRDFGCWGNATVRHSIPGARYKKWWVVAHVQDGDSLCWP